MKVLVVTNMYPSDGDVSWRGSFVKEQVESYKYQYGDVVVDVFHIKGRVSAGSNFNYITSLPSLLFKLFFGRYDVVHCHHAFCVLLCVPWFFRLIYTVHEGELNNTSWRSTLIKLAISLSKIPIFVSHAEYLKSKSRSKHFLPCGINFALFKPVGNKVDLRSSLGISSGKFVILFPADPCRPEKRAGVLREVQSMSEKDNKSWEYIYGGNISRSEMPLWMAASSVVVSIGEYESDGVVIKEAMACNTPVLASDVGNAKLYLNEGSGLIVSSEPNEVYRALNNISEHPWLFSDGRKKLVLLGQDATSTVKTLHSIYKESVY